jgi:vacuolar-type H+-ATPase subunit I/STV1
VPKSRVRKTVDYIPPPTRSPKKRVSPPWLAPTMVACLIVGVIWLVIGYVTQYTFPGMDVLGGQAGNLIEGFGLLVIGLGLATQWR